MSDSTDVHRFKLVILGDTGVGKTSLAVRFVRNAFRKFETTTGGTFYTQKVDLEEDDTDDSTSTTTSTTTIKFNIWDTAGGERFRSVAPLYYKSASAAIVMYDVTSYLSFVSAKTWIEELWERGDCNPELVIALVGNKVDLLEPEPSKNKNKNNNNNVMNTLEEADAYAREVNILHLGTSAKTATNVKALFYKIAKKLPKPKIDPLPPDDDDNDNNDEQETLIVAAAAAAASEASPQGNCERISVTVRRVLASSMAATLLCCFKRKRRRGG